MKIIETNIPDFIEDENKSKIALADKILTNIVPLLNVKFQEKLKNIKLLKESVINKKNKVSTEKIELESLMKEYNRIKKVKVLLERIMNLLGSGLLIGEFKKEMIVVLKVIEDLNEDKLNFYLSETVRVLNKK